MSITSLFRLNLRRLILLLAIPSALIMFLNSMYASYRVQRQMLMDNTLASNHACGFHAIRTLSPR
jgi:hypothetical protein